MSFFHLRFILPYRHRGNLYNAAASSDICRTLDAREAPPAEILYRLPLEHAHSLLHRTRSCSAGHIFVMQKHSKIGHVPPKAAQPCNQQRGGRDGPHMQKLHALRSMPVFVVRSKRMKFYTLFIFRFFLV